eukprot:Gb_05767 [translate_table: standard]
MHFRRAVIGLFALEVLNHAVRHKGHMGRGLCKKLIPHLELTKDCSVKRLENFGDYVGSSVCYHIAKVAECLAEHPYFYKEFSYSGSLGLSDVQPPLRTKACFFPINIRGVLLDKECWDPLLFSFTSSYEEAGFLNLSQKQRLYSFKIHMPCTVLPFTLQCFIDYCTHFVKGCIKVLTTCLVDTIRLESGRIVRQLGSRENNTYPWLSKLADDYLRASRSTSDASSGNILSHLSRLCSEEEIESLYAELVKEFEACILSYFAFHWDYSSVIIDQVLENNSQPKKKLRVAVISAIRKHRFEKALKTLRTKNVFLTLLEQLRAIGHYSPLSDRNNVVVPANANVRSPVLLLVGGGMGAGKSSVVRDILKCSFWSCVAESAVVVEADAFKETDLIYQALNSDGHSDMVETAEFVHKSSTDAASSLLVSALNEGRDIIFDGTMSWKPFVQQTIAMVRDIHNRRYRMGPGYQIGSDGVVHEKYWEPSEYGSLEEVSTGESDKRSVNGLFSEATNEIKERVTQSGQSRKPYRIELIGVVCDATLAVVRGMRRAILTRRAVRIREQLISHKMFADAFHHYCELVDHVKLYCTNNIAGTTELIGFKEWNSKLLVDPEGIKALKKLSLLNPNAKSILELYDKQSDGNELDKGWKEIVLSSERHSQQQQLQDKIQRIESLLLMETSAGRVHLSSGRPLKDVL